jgi:hypothetical protein
MGGGDLGSGGIGGIKTREVGEPGAEVSARLRPLEVLE